MQIKNYAPENQFTDIRKHWREIKDAIMTQTENENLPAQEDFDKEIHNLFKISKYSLPFDSKKSDIEN